MRQNQNEETEVKDMEVNDEVYSNKSISLSSEMSDNSGNEMEIDEVHSRRKSSNKMTSKIRSVKKRHRESHQSHRRDVKTVIQVNF